MADIFELFKQISAKTQAAQQTPPEWVVAGLGNPGTAYALTRHNTGFLTLELLAKAANAEVTRLRFHALLGDGTLSGSRVLLVKPQTFMNNSGQAIREILDWYKLPPQRLIVLYDDISLEPGRLRIRKKGSDGGHNGMKSILYHLGTDAFPRVKIGVGAPPTKEYELADWVLGRFPEGDVPNMRSAMERACGAVRLIMTEGCDAAASRYNASVPETAPGNSSQ